jgi:hypothetical protein
MSFIIQIQRQDSIQYFAGFHTVKYRQCPRLTEYKSRARYWTTGRGANAMMAQLLASYRDWVSPDYNPAEISVQHVNEADVLLAKYGRHRT